MWGEYLVQSKQFDEAERVLKEVFASDQVKESSFASGWDSFTLIRGNFQYGVCLRQRHEDALALEYFEKARRLLDERIQQMGTFQNRHMVEERVLVLKPLQELYAELGYPQKAAEAQATIAELQKILDRIPR
jgi:tetratricopeptide (TPR) repeat protein